MTSNKQLIALLVGGLLWHSHTFAAEAAWSHYIPGTYGDFASGVVEDATLQLRNDIVLYKGDTPKGLMQGRLNRNMEIDGIFNVFQANYFTPYTIFGGRYGLGVKIPFHAVDYTGEVSFNNVTYVPVEVDRHKFADITLTPVMLNWQWGANQHITLFEEITAPTAAYDINRNYNIGRKHWTFETGAHYTYFCPALNMEASATIGWLANLENTETHYLTGAEFHADYNIAYYFASHLALGLTGFFYDQVTGDQNEGAIFGRFESGAFGIGSSLLYSFDVPPMTPLKLIVKWVYEPDTENRYQGNSIFVSLAADFKG